MTEETSTPATELLEFIESTLAVWLNDQEGSLAEIKISALAPVEEELTWLTLPDGTKKSVSPPSKISFATSDLRDAQADPERGAWITARLWMDATDKILHTHMDWMTEPTWHSDPPSDLAYLNELQVFPRTPDNIPDWLATRAKRAADAQGIPVPGLDTNT